MRLHFYTKIFKILLTIAKALSGSSIDIQEKIKMQKNLKN